VGEKLRKGRCGKARDGAISTISPGYPQVAFTAGDVDGAARAGPRARGEKVGGLAHPVKSEGPRGYHNDRPPSPARTAALFAQAAHSLSMGKCTGRAGRSTGQW